MIKIGVLGLGTIAQKAYLPVMSRMHDRVSWVLCTRNPETLAAMVSKYHFQETVPSVEALLESGIEAVFIHTPTNTHAHYIKIFLENNIHVFVDKPVSESIQEVLELHNFASEQGLILFTGFNRRSAPFITHLKQIPNKSQIIIQKNRENTKQDTQFAVFDMMIHVVDTLIYLMDDMIVSTRYRCVENDDGTLNHAIVYLETQHCSAQASINMMSGGRKESVEILSLDGHYRLDDLDTLTIQSNGQTRIETFSDWTDTLEKRGFTQMIEHFVESIMTQTKSPVYTPESSIAAHALIDELYRSK